MKIAWCTPYGRRSAIGRFSSSVAKALTLRGHSLTLVSSELNQGTDYCPHPVEAELVHWTFFKQAPAPLDTHDVIVYNVGNHFDDHCGTLRLIDSFPGVCIFHEFYLVNLFLGWFASGVQKAIAHSVVSSIYGEQVAAEFFVRIERSDFREWSVAQAPMTEWLARKALAAVAHGEFYKSRLKEACAGLVSVLPIACGGPSHRRITEEPSSRISILTAGFVDANKRVNVVIEAIGYSPLLRSRCEYNIVGCVESYRAELQSLIDELDLGSTVRIHGEVTDFELKWRYNEADIVCCLGWPALEGASATCTEAMSYGKAVIVTETGSDDFLAPDCVLKVRPSHEMPDLTRHLEMLAVDAGERNALGQRARKWIEVEHTPERYAERIESLLETVVTDRPCADALKQIGQSLHGIGLSHSEPIVQRIGSEFRHLFYSGPQNGPGLQPIGTGMDPVKWISNLLREPVPDLSNPAQRTLASTDAETEEPPAEMYTETQRAELRSFVQVPSAQEQVKQQAPTIVDRSRALIWRLGVRCAKPVLSWLRIYFIKPLVNAVLYEGRRMTEIEQSVRAIQTVRSGLEQVQRQIYTVREKLEDLAARVDRAETRSRMLTNRHVLFLDDELLARTAYGYLLAPSDDLAFVGILCAGEIWQPATARLLDLVLKEGMTFVDVGAHVGTHTLHGARKVGPTGSVIAFEPTPATFLLLQRSIHFNGLSDVCRCINLALSSSEGVVTLHVAATSRHNSLHPLGAEEEKATLQVRTTTLDKALPGSKRIDVVKIDVEGSELEVLEGMKQVLAENPEIVLIVTFASPQLERIAITPTEWFARFFDLGFAMLALDEKAAIWRQITEKEAGYLGSTNVAFVRPETKHWSAIKKYET